MAAADPAASPGQPAEDLRASIRDRALKLGFDAVGFAPAALGDAVRGQLAQFLAQGYHGDMGWMADKAERRGDPAALWPDARSVIVLGTNYAPADDPLRLAAHPDRGVVSVYARHRDYHDVIKGRLKNLAQWLYQRWRAEVKVFVDTAPVMEKPLAELAGLGWRGKHTNLVSRRFGSWLFLGEIYTTLTLPPDPPGVDRCGSCVRCQVACPTQAFPAPYQLDARRCIAYLTIEHAGPVHEDLRPLLGNRVYGCDDCLAVCPWNRFAQKTREAAFFPRIELTAPRLADLAQLQDGDFRRIFSGSPIKRIGRDRLVRNALYGLGNSGDGQYKAVVAGLLNDRADVVRDAAGWALARLHET